jgi:hypothetical protein
VHPHTYATHGSPNKRLKQAKLNKLPVSPDWLMAQIVRQ